MADLISRAVALEVIDAVKSIVWSQSGKVLCGKMYSQIKDLPAVDAVPVIRCKDCKHWKAVDCCSFFTCKYDILNGFVNKGYGYCSYGERRDET